MTDPRRPDDARLSTADLAAASNREVDREMQADRDVTHQAQQTRAGVVADATVPRAVTDDEDRSSPLFAGNESDDFRRRWTDVQAGFVDEPRKAVESADVLVASAIKRLAEIFAQERSNLEGQWARGDDVSTEDLRVALRRYRSFFDRLLSV
jgi:hypothetical protein